jgi:hypothetical protein
MILFQHFEHKGSEIISISTDQRVLFSRLRLADIKKIIADTKK